MFKIEFRCFQNTNVPPVMSINS